MDLLVEKMQKLLATSFTMYLKAHRFHWNIEGQDFHQYHEFFGDLYSEIWGSVDATAEQIRALKAKAKGSLTEFKELSTVRDQITDLSIQEMNAMLLRDNDSVIAVLNEVHEEAEKQKKYGLLNYIEGRLDIHNKHGWMLRASITTPAVAEEVVTIEEPTQQVAESLTEEVKVYILNPEQ